MKKLLIAAATAAEIEPFMQFLQSHYQALEGNVFHNKNYQIRVLITGVGMMHTAFALANDLASQTYDGALQSGIAGAFDTSIKLGEVVAVQSECYGDLGAENKGDFIDIVDLGFINPYEFPYTNGQLVNDDPLLLGAPLPMYSSLSVNTVSGTQTTINARNTKYQSALETMEGIAFHYACKQAKIPFLQIRAVSNYVTPRNKAEWNIPLAIQNLNQYLIETFK